MLKNKSDNFTKEPHPKTEAASGFLHSFLDFWSPIMVTLLLYTGIRQYLGEARYIPSGSMLPGLQINDRLFIEKLTFRRRSPRRGEVVVFKSPFSFDAKLIGERTKPLPSSFRCGFSNLPGINIFPGLSDRACDAYIKRVVAIEGDLVQVGQRGELFINSKLVQEPYVSNFCKLSQVGFENCKPLTIKVPIDHVFVLGDNRSNSWDGRYWPGSNFLPKKEIIGRAAWRFWPLNRLGKVR